MYVNLPHVMIETKRLMLRPLRIGDLQEFFALQDHPDVLRFVRSLDRPEPRDWLQEAEREWEERGYGMFAVLNRADGRFIGRAGMKYWPQLDETELGWVFRRDAWGHGYATEAARACRDWGFCSLSVPYLTAMIQAANDRSAAVARRLGLSPLRTDVLLGTKVVVYALSRDDWAPAGLDEH
jgi:RimJ/RimL family protein N-acetyltransferase